LDWVWKTSLTILSLFLIGIVYILPFFYLFWGICFVATVVFVLAIYWRYNYFRMMKLDPSHPITKPSPNKEGRKMKVRIINFDDALLSQNPLLQKYQPQVYDATNLGPKVRMGCGYENYKWLESHLSNVIGSKVDGKDQETLVTFFGSNDFHHISLALVRRIRQPINAVLFDVHPDFLLNPFGHHCGSWFQLVTSLPTVHQAFHFGGGSGEFEDDLLLPLVPWHHILSGKLRVFPASNDLTKGKWSKVETPLLRERHYEPLRRERALQLLSPFRDQLRARPLYITLDKDCLSQGYCLQNWNSGILTGPEVYVLIEVLVELSEGRLLAIDITGDWSEVNVKGWFRNILHSQQHDEAQNKLPGDLTTRINTRTNLQLLETIEKAIQFVPKK